MDDVPYLLLAIARVALRLSQSQAAQLAKVSPRTIASIEAGKTVWIATLRKVEAAYVKEGIVFSYESDDEIGIKFRNKIDKK